MTANRFALLVTGSLALIAMSDCLLAAEPASGPLTVSKQSPRYFADASGRIVYLTGSHTWNNLVDMGRSDPPEAFDFEAYLDMLATHGHNFIRLWAWDSTVWDTQANGSLGKDYVHHVAPLPWSRTGPGNAHDGLPKFDLTRFDPHYFERLKARVDGAGKRGIYVSVMLFEGWGLMHGNQGRAAPEGWAWRSHPFHADNNINGLTVEGANEVTGHVHRLNQQALGELQAAYIRHVVDTVNHADNVLYEVINEGGEREWDRWVIKIVREHERTKPKQHPIGLTGHGAEKLDSMLDSDADWVSPGRVDGFAEDPPVWEANHDKVSLLDTDHVWGVGGSADWVWKGFLRGHNPIFMDPCDGSVLGKPNDPQWEPIRRAMGQTRRFAAKVDLATLVPEPDLASTGYCLTDKQTEYLVYAPSGGALWVDLSGAKKALSVEWYAPERDESIVQDETAPGARQDFKPPFAGAAVLYIKSQL